MRTIKLMADYDCHALWASGGEVGNIDPKTLPLSDSLKTRLDAWAEKYDATLNRDDPRESGFASVEEEQAFKDEGAKLAAALRSELGEGYTITTRM